MVSINKPGYKGNSATLLISLYSLFLQMFYPYRLGFRVSPNEGDGLHRPQPVPRPRLLQRGQPQRGAGVDTPLRCWNTVCCYRDTPSVTETRPDASGTSVDGTRDLLVFQALLLLGQPYCKKDKRPIANGTLLSVSGTRPLC